MSLTAIEYRLLVELSVHAGRVLTYEHLLRRVWCAEGDGYLRPMRTAISAIRRKLGDDAANPIYILTELRLGYRMARGETQEPLNSLPGLPGGIGTLSPPPIITA